MDPTRSTVRTFSESDLSSGAPMPKIMPLLAKPAPVKTPRVKTPRRVEAALPMRMADLADCELVAQCESCGRHLRLHPGHTDFDSRTRLVSLLDRLLCTARRNSRTCGGRPRRLTLTRDEQSWVLDEGGAWIADDTAFWEAADFEAIQKRAV